MSPFQNFDTEVLLDMLMQETEKLIKLFKNNPSGNEYDGCKKIIEALQAELEMRKGIASHVPATNKDIAFKDGETV